MYNFLCTLVISTCIPHHCHHHNKRFFIWKNSFSRSIFVKQTLWYRLPVSFFFLFFLIQAQRTSFDTLLLPCIVKQLQKFNTTQTVHLIYENYGILYYLWTKSIMHIIIIHELQNGTKWLPSSQLLSCFTALWILDFILALLDILFL